MDAGRNRSEFSERTIVTSRLIDAPCEQVFDAFTDPGHLARWWGPDGFTTTTHAFDMRPGGQWRFTMHGPDGRDYENRITYDEIVRPTLIRYRHGGDVDLEPVQFQTTITFEPVGAKTRITLAALFPTAEERDRVVREYKADEGGRQTLGRLAQVIEEDTFTLTRTLNAPRDLVWKLWTDAQHLPKWWGPKGFVWLTGSLDLRPGGKFHYGMRMPNGEEMWGRFVFREIAAPERLVFVVSFSDKDGGMASAPFFDGWPMEVLNVLTLTEQNGRTALTLRSAPINTAEAERTKFRGYKASMTEGWGGTIEKLETYLATQQP